MSHKTSIGTTAMLVAALALGLAATATAAPARGRAALDPFAIASERLDARTLAFDTEATYSWATLTVSGPQGVTLRKKFKASEPLTLSLAGETGDPLADGRYRYRLRLMPRGEAGNIQTGLFFIEDGQAVSRRSKRAELSQIRERLNLARRERQQAQTRVEPGPETKLQRAPGTRSEGLQPLSPEVAPKPTVSAVADQLVIYGDSPELYFYENAKPPDYYGPYHSALYSTYGGQIRASFGGSLMNYALSIFEASHDNYRGAMYSQDQAWVSQVSWGGWHSQGGYDHVVFGYGYSYGTYYTPGLLALQHRFYDLDASVYETLGLYVTRAGVGLRTQSPGADLEIYDPGSFAAFRLNNGLASWAVTNTPYGVISFNQIGTGGQEMTVRTRFDAVGPTFEVQGSIRATNVSFTSSREHKTDFESLDGSQVLDRLSQLPIQSWRYKHEADGVRHIGPMAEDFHQLFRIGDDQHLSTVDVTGVMMAAIQQLGKDNEELRRRIAELEDRRPQGAAEAELESVSDRDQGEAGRVAQGLPGAM